MADNGSVLSQDAIDSLLNSIPAEDEGSGSSAAPAADAQPAEPEPEAEVAEEPQPAAEEAPAPQPEPVAEAPPPPQPEPVAAAAAPQPAPVAAAPPPPPPPQPIAAAAPQPQPMASAPPPAADSPGGGVDHDTVVMLAGEAAESATAPIQADVAQISSRVDALEQALQRIASLEAELAQLKQQSGGGAPRGMEQRLEKLESAAKGSPVFGLYDKFSCSSCGSKGAAQVKARCGHCGKEGWFGRKEAPPNEPQKPRPGKRPDGPAARKRG